MSTACPKCDKGTVRIRSSIRNGDVRVRYWECSKCGGFTQAVAAFDARKPRGKFVNQSK